MIADIALPIQKVEEERDEILIVYFDGFIKNESEGMIQTMIRDKDQWIEKYPDIINFMNSTSGEIYHETMLFRPAELLNILSGSKLTDDEISNDMESIIPEIIFEKTTMTTFEFALYRILQEKNIKQCYFFKDTEFYDNEIAYVNKKYKDVLSKIEFVNGGLLTLYDQAHPTTLFVNNPTLPISIFPSRYSDDDLSQKMFILLNSSHNLQCNEITNSFEYTKEFSDQMKKINEESSYGLFAMFNFPLLEQEADEPEEDEED